MRRWILLIVVAAGFRCRRSSRRRSTPGAAGAGAARWHDRGARAPADVQVVRDTWGVPHIYAQSTDDLFFAQGYVMAQDRLWQMEMWRRAGEGRLAEVLGPAALARDRQARLLKYRGPIDERELSSYHPQGRHHDRLRQRRERVHRDAPRTCRWSSR